MGNLARNLYLEGKAFALFVEVPNLLAQAKFAQQVASGAWFSEPINHIFQVIVRRSSFFENSPYRSVQIMALLTFHANWNPRLGRPSSGSWVTYGFRRQNKLKTYHGFGSIDFGGKTSKMLVKVSGFLLPTLLPKGCNVASKGDPVFTSKDPDGMTREMKK